MTRSPTRSLIPTCPALAALLLAAAPASQCEPQWQAGDPISTPFGTVLATTLWDPDGSGPQPLSLVVAGRFDLATSTDASVAIFDGSQWSVLPNPLGTVTALGVFQGQLVAAAATAVRLWNGSAWQLIGTVSANGVVPEVEAITVHQGDLYIGGRFDVVAGAPATNIARWNGTSWSGLGSGVTGTVHALASHTWQLNPGLYVGGEFTTAGGSPASNLAVWNGSSWAQAAPVNGPVLALGTRLGTSASNSYLFVAGAFTSVAGTPVANVARFHAATNTWVALGSNLPPATGLRVRSTGLNSYEVAANTSSTVWRWGTSSWNQLSVATGPAGIEGLVWYAGRYTIGKPDGCWAFDGTYWLRVHGQGLDGPVFAVAAAGTDVVIGGAFRSISGVPMLGVARGSANAWAPLGSGVLGSNGIVRALLRLPNGDVIAGGSFTTATGAAADHVARWDGTAWQPMGGGVNGTVEALALLPNGDVVAGGLFTFAGATPAANIARWNGTYWSDFDGGVDDRVLAIAVRPDGGLAVAGWFTHAGSAATPAARIAQWNGVAWSQIGGGLTGGSVNAMTWRDNAELLLAGLFSPAGGSQMTLARWIGDGTWYGLPSAGSQVAGIAQTLTFLPNGDLVVGGDLVVSTPTGSGFDGLARRRGASWQPLNVDGIVRHAVLSANGDLVAGGHFTTVGPLTSAYVARLAVSCPATAVPFGAGCAGSNGPTALAATALPWIGAVCRARASGMPQNAFALAVWGFGTLSLPLAAVLPQAGPGCSLLVTPDVLDPLLPSAGIADSQVALPATITLAGQTFHHQVVALEFDAALSLVSVAGTNALTLTVGAL